MLGLSRYGVYKPSILFIRKLIQKNLIHVVHSLFLGFHKTFTLEIYISSIVFSVCITSVVKVVHNKYFEINDKPPVNSMVLKPIVSEFLDS